MIKRKICIVTGTRAEYGHLYWLLKSLEEDPSIDLQLVVTGMHLSSEFGQTYKTIEADGFKISERVENLLAGDDTPIGTAKSIGLGVSGFAEVFSKLNPDIVVLLGDRFEIFAASQAAMVLRIPIAHIHGGESTVGAIDEAIRHSITKMSQLHFVAAEEYRKRVIQLGEHPSRVLNFGAPGLENIIKLPLLNRRDLGRKLNFNLEQPYFLVTYHPVTLKKDNSQDALNELFRALDAFPTFKVIMTKANADAEGRLINRMIDEFAKDRPQRVFSSISLGQTNYLSALKHASAVIGNSSSGILEAPVLKVATVNLGDRQLGRLKAASIIDCEEHFEAIKAAIATALTPKFQSLLKDVVSLYGTGSSSSQIKEYLKAVDLNGLVQKKFYDLRHLSQ